MTKYMEEEDIMNIGSGGGSWYYYSDDRFEHCASLTDGKFAAAGGTYNNGGSGVGSINSNVMLTVWNSNGTVSWTKWISVAGSQNNNSSNVGSTTVEGVAVDGNNNVYVHVFGSGGSSGEHIIKLIQVELCSGKKLGHLTLGLLVVSPLQKWRHFYWCKVSSSYGSYVPGIMK